MSRFFMLSGDKRIMQCGVEPMRSCTTIKLVVIHFVGLNQNTEQKKIFSCGRARSFILVGEIPSQ